MEFISQYITEILALLSNMLTGYIAYKKGKKSGG